MMLNEKTINELLGNMAIGFEEFEELEEYVNENKNIKVVDVAESMEEE